MTRAVLIALLSLSTLATSASAQSIFSARGFGVPLAPLDPRSQALGGIGIGLLDGSQSIINPAELDDYPFRGAIVSMQSLSRELHLDGLKADIESSRFPLLRIIYPVGERLSLGVGYGGFLDQSWSVSTSHEGIVGGETVEIRDLVSADGGIGQLRVALSYAITPTLAIGVDGGIYSGSLDERIAREFGSGAPSGIESVERKQSWTQKAPLASIGIRWDPAPIARISGSLTWAGDLERTPGEAPLTGIGTPQQVEKVKMPLQAAFGASAYFVPGLLGSVSARWAGWGSAADSFDPNVRPDDTWEYGLGFEWTRMEFGNTGVPLRFGYHRADLPFSYNGVRPRESSFTFGFGLHFSRTSFGPLASIDAALEKGERIARGTGLSESFWRFTLGMGVFGR